MPRSNLNPLERGYARELLDLYTLSAFAVSQPLFDRLSAHVTYLIDRGLTGGSLVLLAGALLLIVPTLMAVVEALVRAVHPGWRRGLHAVFAGLLLVAIACPVARHLVEHERLLRLGIAGYLGLLLALSAGVLMTIAYLRTEWFPRWIAWTSPAIVLFPAAFLLLGPAATVLLPTRWERRPAQSGRPVPVVMVVFDEFCGMSLLNEEHRIDSVRYPQFARLADTATWYRNATTVHPRTPGALPAILTGSMPHGVDRPASESEYPQNLFRLLQETSQYEFVIFETVGRFASRELNRELPSYPMNLVPRVGVVLPTLCAVYLDAVLPACLPLETPRIAPEWYGLASDDGTRPVHGKGVFDQPWIGARDVQCKRFLACLDHSRRPSLYFIHVCLPHYPWCYLPSGRRHTADLAGMGAPLGAFGAHGESWTDDELVVRHAWQAYLLQVGYVDQFVGQLQDRLQQLGVFDDCLLIVTADHGLAFVPGLSRREPEGANLPEILSVPLLIKYPQQRAGVVDDRNIESIDILPTIADVLDLELPFPVDGSSVRDDGVPPRARKTLMRDDGELIVVDPRLPLRFDGVDRLIAAFGTGTRDDRLWRNGLFPELIGRNIGELAIAPVADVVIEPFPRHDTGAERSGDVIPCCVQGRIVDFGSHGQPLTLAVAVNGAIAGVTRTSRDPRISDQFAVMVSEAAFSSADDDVRLFAVFPGSGLPMLEPCLVTEGPGAERSDPVVAIPGQPP